ncbi:hypothetical protein NDK47_27595 (plasmid) [Brevibacillus ruminantium]|uniref:Uncharacterized protein n=1 Tax=Brevibacillus ruminantium TaxID=2950604 RepID=A0ABY4WR33_9BACL|nr:hypothetical protein [Brevibacillus ruminantium]USG68552.1 hypothetical protein NDK47_27595 [Brevibacillus ruminantium]
MRKPIQVPEEVKTKVEDLKRQLQARTEYEVIEKLIGYYEKKQCHLHLDEAVKEEFRAAKNQLRIYSDSDFVKFLLHHWSQSKEISKEALNLLLTIR